MSYDIERLADIALDAFWEAIVEEFPEVKHGDLSPERTMRLQIAAEEAVAEWIRNNVDGASDK